VIKACCWSRRLTTTSTTAPGASTPITSIRSSR
jgi:hypothetical protein